MIEDINTFRRQDEYKYNMMELIKIDENDNEIHQVVDFNMPMNLNACSITIQHNVYHITAYLSYQIETHIPGENLLNQKTTE